MASFCFIQEGHVPQIEVQEEAVMWARRLKIAYFFIFWLNRAKFDRACECPANGPAWSSMVPHVQHVGRCGTLREFAGICWTIAGICWTLRDTAGHRGRVAAAAATGNTITMASESICSVMTPDQTSSPPRIHHRRPSAHVLGAAVVYFDATHPFLQQRS